jgi:3-methyladenine DNA glycosylase AlkD
MTLTQALRNLESLGTEAMRKHNTKWGANDNQFGVKHGDIRTLAKKIETDHPLALSLWKTNNLDAQLLAVLLFDPKALTAKDLDRLVRTISFAHVADWLISYIIKPHPDKESLREKWMHDKNPWAARAAWSLTAERVVKSPDRIESEIPTADPAAQWTMNAALAEIGIHLPKLRKRALSIGETLGLYRDYPTSKGCTSPFAPIWINTMVSRKD